MVLHFQKAKSPLFIRIFKNGFHRMKGHYPMTAGSGLRRLTLGASLYLLYTLCVRIYVIM